MSQAGLEPPLADDTSYEAEALPTKPRRLELYKQIEFVERILKGERIIKHGLSLFIRRKSSKECFTDVSLEFSFQISSKIYLLLIHISK